MKAEGNKETTKQDFEIVKQIGKGSYATVFKVLRKEDNEVYAMKCIDITKMDKTQLQNTLNEIRILCSVTHPNIVGYKEAFVEKASKELCIVMEYVGGGDLSTKITECYKRKLLISEQTIWRYFIQILQGLEVLHKINIIHRDIKSANIFLSSDFSTVKLGDLNIAKIAKNEMAQTQIGTPYYLAPEIWKNEPYNFKCDIFSLGCVTYEMSTLRVPFDASSLSELFK